jgi:hypothetical protein
MGYMLNKCQNISICSNFYRGVIQFNEFYTLYFIGTSG